MRAPDLVERMNSLMSTMQMTIISNLLSCNRICQKLNCTGAVITYTDHTVITHHTNIMKANVWCTFLELLYVHDNYKREYSKFNAN